MTHDEYVTNVLEVSFFMKKQNVFVKTLLKRIRQANASDTNSDMNFNLELGVDDIFRFATTSDKETKTLKNNRLTKK